MGVGGERQSCCCCGCSTGLYAYTHTHTHTHTHKPGPKRSEFNGCCHHHYRHLPRPDVSLCRRCCCRWRSSRWWRGNRKRRRFLGCRPLTLLLCRVLDDGRHVQPSADLAATLRLPRQPGHRTIGDLPALSSHALCATSLFTVRPKSGVGSGRVG